MSGLVNERPPLSFRIVTPDIAKTCVSSLPAPSLKLPLISTIQQLHDEVAKSLGSTNHVEGHTEVDLHTHEMPIHPSAFHLTLDESGLSALASADGAVTIYAVRHYAAYQKVRATLGRGMDDIYLARSCWSTHDAPQSKRGIAIMLSTLRVFTHLIRHSKESVDTEQAVLYLLDLITHFPPAMRTMHILIKGNTPTAVECAALGNSLCHVLNDIVPSDLTKGDPERLFEGARLLLGLLMDKAKHLRMTNDERKIPPYLDYLRMVRIGQSNHEVTGNPSHPADLSMPTILRAKLLGGQTVGQILVFCPEIASLQQPHVLGQVIALEEVQDLNHLAAISGSVSLAVAQPSALASVVAPALTFDSDGHVAVYTGRQACASPGEDLTIFRPHHGSETPDMAVVEQKLAPILLRYKSDRTEVFDVIGTPEGRRLESPDEILMFAVDCSYSMSDPTDFPSDRKKAASFEDGLSQHIEVSSYAHATLAETRDFLLQHETFGEIIAAVLEAAQQRPVAVRLLQILCGMLVRELVDKRKYLRRFTQQSPAHKETQSKIDKIQIHAGGLRTHEDALADFIIVRARTTTVPSTSGWTWDVGDPMPDQNSAERMPALPSDVTDIPIDVRCPISYEVLQDPVVAADRQTYSLQAITKWFQLRKSSPLTGLSLLSTELTCDHDRADYANDWIRGKEILENVPSAGAPKTRKRAHSPSPHLVNITMSSQADSFIRSVPASLTLHQLYSLAFRGMRGRHNLFQLSFMGHALPVSQATILSYGITDGNTVIIRVQDAGDLTSMGVSPLCLLKMYTGHHNMDFAYWVPMSTDCTVAMVLIKYWRYQLKINPFAKLKDVRVWTGMSQAGDGKATGSVWEPHNHLSDLLGDYSTRSGLDDEPVFTKDSHSDSDAEDDDEDDDSGDGDEPPAFVLKIMVTGIKERDDELNRLAVLKQMFEALINRVLAYNYSTHIGLITFDSEARVSQNLTHVIENFRRSVESMEAKGDTTLWDALSLASDLISQYAQRFPNALKRIICLSDGNDTKSVISAQDVYWKLRQNKISVDSILLGSDENVDLMTVSHLLGSYCFKPDDMATALATCELEPMLSLTERPATKPVRMFDARSTLWTHFRNARRQARLTTVTQDVFPARKEHPRLTDNFIQLSDTVRRSGSFGTASVSRSNLRSSRLMSEMRSIATNPNPQYDCYVSESDVSFWKVVVEGVSHDLPLFDCFTNML